MVRVEDVKYKGENPEAPSQDLKTHSTILTGSTRATVVEGLRASAGFEQNLRKASKQVRPNALILGLEYEVSSAVALAEIALNHVDSRARNNDCIEIQQIDHVHHTIAVQVRIRHKARFAPAIEHRRGGFRIFPGNHASAHK